MLELTWAIAWLHAGRAAARARLDAHRTIARTRRHAMATSAGGGLGRRSRRLRLTTLADDVGASIVETVVIIGLFVAAAIVIVAILVAKAKGAADNVKTQ